MRRPGAAESRVLPVIWRAERAAVQLAERAMISHDWLSLRNVGNSERLAVYFWEWTQPTWGVKRGLCGSSG